MTHALNLTLPIKQDPETKAKLARLKQIFPTQVQPKIEEALKKSRLVHFARVVVIDDKYIQVITEYEGPHQEYTEFFRKALTPIFAAIFDLAADVPDVNDTNAFWTFAKDHNYRSLGTASDGSLDFGGNPAGWLFSAYDHKTVRDIQAKLAEPAS
ncbi:MAG: hypothetical protein ACO1NY_14085 [Pseudorhodoplanes sp.]